MRFSVHIALLLLIPGITIYGQEKNAGRNEFKTEMYKAKKAAIDYLSDSTILKKYGSISDLIWNYAELGMQEFKSASLLIKTLEEEGFRVEKEVAGMPTCFVASWGSGKPVIGILGEFDALPMISQKALIPHQEPLVKGAPGHGCGHNMMGTAGIAAAIAGTIGRMLMPQPPPRA